MYASFVKRFTLGLIGFVLVLGLSVVVFQAPKYRYPLAIIGIFQNDADYLKEWIDFHKLMGVEHFYLYNHLSDDHYLEVLQPYIEQGFVELEDWNFPYPEGKEAEWNKIQTAAYRDGLGKAKGQAKWVAILDTDEFLFPLEKANLIEFLDDYCDCSALLVNWQVFGTSYVPKIPKDQLLIETLFFQTPESYPVNTFCKSIVRPEKVKYCNDPHFVFLHPWSFSVDADKDIFNWKYHFSHPVKVDKVRINHYWSRDEEFFQKKKISRYTCWGPGKEACLKRNEEANLVIDKSILRFFDPLKKLQKID